MRRTLHTYKSHYNIITTTLSIIVCTFLAGTTQNPNAPTYAKYSTDVFKSIYPAIILTIIALWLIAPYLWGIVPRNIHPFFHSQGTKWLIRTAWSTSLITLILAESNTIDAIPHACYIISWLGITLGLARLLSVFIINAKLNQLAQTTQHKI